jgi:hypothetical protein
MAAWNTPLASRFSALAVAFLLTVGGCGGGGSSNGGSSATPPPSGGTPPPGGGTTPPPGGGTTPPPTGSIEVENHVTGSVGDGPIVNARVRVFASNGALLRETTSSGSADYDLVIKTQGKNYTLMVLADQGTDLVTNAAPDFRLLSAIQRPSTRTVSNLNPFSTLIYETARKNGGINDSTVAAARHAVVSRYGFGLDTALIADPVQTPITGDNVHVIVKSSETLGEMIRRTRDAMVATGANMDGDAVVAALAADLVDGWIDGMGAIESSSRVAAVANVASAAVLIEAMSNQLQVYGVNATEAMDQSIRQVRPDAPPGATTSNVAIPAATFQQAARVLRAAQRVKPDPTIAATLAVIEAAPDGASPDDIAAQLPEGVQGALRQATTDTAFASDATIDAVNTESRTVNTPPAPEPEPEPTPPAPEPEPEPTPTPPAPEPEPTPTPPAPEPEPTPTPPAPEPEPEPTPPAPEPEPEPTPPAPEPEPPPPPPVNNPPVISGTPTTALVVGTAWSFTPTASDPDGDALTFSIAGRPSWASFNSSTGRLSGTPASAHVGTYSNIRISVSDGQASAQLPAFSLTVSPPPNNPPVISGTPTTALVVGTAWSFTPTASDPDGDTLTFSVTGAPAWMNFNSSSGRLSGTPSSTHVGTYSNIRITVSDGQASAMLPAFSLTVSPPPNNPPVISGTPTTALVVGTAWSFTPTASDPDGDALTFSIAGRPSWASFNSSTGRLSGTPGSSHVGTYSNIRISVSDGQATAQLPAFSLTVSAAPPPPNSPPVISGTPTTALLVGTAWSFTPTASDPDGDTLTFSVTGAPAWLSFNSATGRLSGTPSSAHVGTHSDIRISVSDGQATAQLPAFSLTVTAPIPATGSASLRWQPPTQRVDGTPLTSIGGYKLYYGLNQSNLDQVINLGNSVTEYQVNNLAQGTWYFGVSAVDSVGVESGLSGMVSKTIP